MSHSIGRRRLEQALPNYQRIPRASDVARFEIGPYQVRQEARHQRAAHRREERIFAAAGTGRRRFVLNPRRDATDVQLGLGVGDADRGQHVKAGGTRGFVVAGDADVHDLFALLPQGIVEHRPEL